MRRIFRTAGCAVALSCLALDGHAAIDVYFGQDVNAGIMPASFTHSLAARTAFLAAAGPVLTEGFEALATGDGLALGARAPFASPIGARIGVDNAIAEAWHFALGGRYPYTGENYLLFVGKSAQVSSLKVDFDRGVLGFGLHATDLGDFAERLTVHLLLDDGATRTIEVPHRFDDLDANASALFFGVRSDTPIARVTIENTALSAGTPYIAFDDFMVTVPPQPASLLGIPPVPEPSPGVLFATGMLTLVPVLRRLARRQGPR